MSLLHHSAARGQVFQEAASLYGASLCGDVTCLQTQTILMHTFLGQ